MVKTEISHHYRDALSNQHGVPVKVIYIDVNPGAGSVTETFIVENEMKTVVDDYTLGTYFAYSGGGTPHFVVINGVAGSTSHAEWEVLGTLSGWNPSLSLGALLNAIESIEGPFARPVCGPAALTSSSPNVFTYTGEIGRTICVEATTNLVDWVEVAEILNTTGTVSYPDPSGAASRFYRAWIK